MGIKTINGAADKGLALHVANMDLILAFHMVS